MSIVREDLFPVDCCRVVDLELSVPIDQSARSDLFGVGAGGVRV